MNEIFNIKFSKCEKWSEHFDELFADDDYGYWESKQTFHHEEGDGLNFDYKYVIEYGVAWDTQPKGIYQLILVPTKPFWHQRIREDVMSVCGCHDFDAITLADACPEGAVIPLNCDCVIDIDEDKCEPKEEVLDAIASVYKFIDSLSGFYLDRPWNGIGTTGWDSLNHILYGEDLFKFR